MLGVAVNLVNKKKLFKFLFFVDCWINLGQEPVFVFIFILCKTMLQHTYINYEMYCRYKWLHSSTVFRSGENGKLLAQKSDLMNWKIESMASNVNKLFVRVPILNVYKNGKVELILNSQYHSDTKINLNLTQQQKYSI